MPVLSQFNGTLNILSSSLQSGNTYNFTGFYNHSTGKFSSTDSAVNDILYVTEGANVVRLVITVITTNTGGIITGRAQDVDNQLSAPPSGVCAIIRETATRTYPLFVDGISEDLQSQIRTHFTMLVEQNSGGTNIYNANGSLTGNRTLTGAGNTLTLGTSLTDLTDLRFNSTQVRADTGTATIRGRLIVGAGDTTLNVRNTSTLNETTLGVDDTIARVQAANSGSNTSNARLEVARERLEFIGNSSSNVAWRYQLPVAQPSQTNGSKQTIVWTGTGSATTSAFENILTIQEYVAGDALITATGAGITVTKLSGTATVTVPAGVTLLNLSLKGQTSDLAGDNSFSIVIDTTSTISNQGNSTIKVPQFQIINTAAQLGGGPSPSLPFIYDEGAAPQRQITALTAGNITLRAINLDAFSNWVITVNP